MQKMLQVTTATASLLLASLPVIGFAQAAHAQERVVASTDSTTFAKRIDGAANAFCGRAYRPNELAATAACKQAVWAEVTAKLASQPASTVAVRDDATVGRGS